MYPFITASEAELLYLDRTRRTALYHRSSLETLNPRPLHRRIAAAMRRTLALAF
jgi:hypothetical protein